VPRRPKALAKSVSGQSAGRARGTQRAVGPFLFRTLDLDFRARGPVVRPAHCNALGSREDRSSFAGPTGQTARRENDWPVGPVRAGALVFAAQGVAVGWANRGGRWGSRCEEITTKTASMEMLRPPACRQTRRDDPSRCALYRSVCRPRRKCATQRFAAGSRVKRDEIFCHGSPPPPEELSGMGCVNYKSQEPSEEGSDALLDAGAALRAADSRKIS
jgi:hypothetical protein